jgi:hypothetical protein
LLLSLGNYSLASAFPAWILGSHHSPFLWLAVTLVAIGLSLALPSSKVLGESRR